MSHIEARNNDVGFDVSPRWEAVTKLWRLTNMDFGFYRRQEISYYKYGEKLPAASSGSYLLRDLWVNTFGTWLVSERKSMNNCCFLLIQKKSVMMQLKQNASTLSKT